MSITVAVGVTVPLPISASAPQWCQSTRCPAAPSRQWSEDGGLFTRMTRMSERPQLDMRGRISRPSQRQMPEITSTAFLLDCSDSGEQQGIALAPPDPQEPLTPPCPRTHLSPRPRQRRTSHGHSGRTCRARSPADLQAKATDATMLEAIVLISTLSDYIARLCDHAIALDSTDSATEVLSASTHRSA